MTRVLLVGGPRHGEAAEIERPGGLIHARGHDPVVGTTCEGYGPADSYGCSDPEGLWPIHHRDTDTAKVTVAFSHDSPYLSAIEGLMIGKTAMAMADSADAASDAWEVFCESAKVS